MKSITTLAALLVLGAAPAIAFAQTVVPTAPPPISAWAPSGCRLPDPDDAIAPSRRSWRNLHADGVSSDEITRAIAPVLTQGWTAESATYNPTGPVFDDDGNLYFSPFLPFENVVLVSLDPATGARRWAIAGTGAPSGSSAPMVLGDPATPGAHVIYLALYDRALAVRPDGSVVWDVPTGLTLGPDPLDNGVLGVNYVDTVDALVAVTVDGFLYVLDRATGAPRLASPFALPGEPSPDLPSAVPPAVLAAAEDAWQVLVDLPDGSFGRFIDVLLGQDVKVANMFSVAPGSGRLWVAATAPDAEDGTVDGISEFGALYGLDLVPAGGGMLAVAEACHASFAGGSASTPTVRADGMRVYVGDNLGELLAVDAASCAVAWQVDVGQQIVGSIAASSDDDVLYAASRDFVTQVFDRGNAGQVGWVADMQGLFTDLSPGQTEFNLNLTSIGANALGFQAGAGVILADVPFAVAVGVGTLDRGTGAVRHFTPGPEETVAVMSTAADGAFYIGNSPVRRALAIGFGLSSDPLVGGITKFEVARHDLLARDAVCAAAGRAANAAAGRTVCPAAGLESDVAQQRELVEQARQAAGAAIVAGQLSPEAWAPPEALLDDAEAALGLAAGDATGPGLPAAAGALGEACVRLGADGTSAKLIVIDKLASANKAKAVWVAKDPAITKGAGTDPAVIDAALSFGWNSVTGAFVVPVGASDGTAGWVANKETVAKYANKAADTGVPTGAKVVTIKPGKLAKLVGKTLGDVAMDLAGAGAPENGIVTRLQIGNDGETTTYCTLFPAGTAAFKEIAGGLGRKLVAKRGLPVACP